jgi:hypothetical protein
LTSAITVQPTEQWVQIDLTMSTAGVTMVCASARVTVPPSAPTAASPPIARPEPRRKPRRSIRVSPAAARPPVRWAPRITEFVFFFSISLSPLLVRSLPAAG